MPRTVAFFDGSTAAAGRELWATDGTAAGTALVADILPGPAGSDPGYFSGFAATGTGKVVFTATDGGPNGPELFASNGTAAGTAELNSGFVQVAITTRVPLYVRLSNFTPLGNARVLFTGPTSPASLQVWSTDGTAAGTQLVKDLTGAGAASNSVNIEPLGNGRAVFQVRAGDAAGLWSTDGTAGGTAQLSGGSDSLIGALGNGQGLFTTADGSGGAVLSVTDGTAAGTRGIYDFSGGYQGSIVAIGGGRALFAASDGQSPSELWATDGTAAGTAKLAQGFARSPYSGGGSSIAAITALGQGRFVFAATGADRNAALWVTDGTAAGTGLVEEIGGGDPNYSIDGITALGGGRALLKVTYKGNYGSALLVTDGTVAGTAVLQKFAPAEQYISALGNITALPGGVAVFTVAVGDGAFQLSGSQVWRTDGTAGGTAQIPLPQGAFAMSPNFNVVPDGRAVFNVSGANGGLWATGGNAASTGPIATTFPVGSFGLATVPDLNPLFDSDYYNARNPDVAAAGLNAYRHYLGQGGAEGRDPDPFFSSVSYLAQNPDVARSGLNPLLHYEQYGWREGRDPGPLFSTRAYLAANPDLAASGLDPLEHFVRYGGAEGRFAFPGLDAKGLVGDFDPQFYLQHNPDVAAVAPAGQDAAEFAFQHYLTYGWKEGRDPDALFSTAYYLRQNPDVAQAGTDPLLHYEQYGWKEGRDPGPGFSTTKYLAAYQDVKAAGLDPLQHYLHYGQPEGRPAFPA